MRGIDRGIIIPISYKDGVLLFFKKEDLRKRVMKIRDQYSIIHKNNAKIVRMIIAYKEFKTKRKKKVVKKLSALVPVRKMTYKKADKKTSRRWKQKNVQNSYKRQRRYHIKKMKWHHQFRYR